MNAKGRKRVEEEFAKATGLTLKQRKAAQEEFDAIAKVVGECPTNISNGLQWAEEALGKRAEKLREKAEDAEGDTFSGNAAAEEAESLRDEVREMHEDLENLLSEFQNDAQEKLTAIAEKLSLTKPSWMEN